MTSLDQKETPVQSRRKSYLLEGFLLTAMYIGMVHQGEWTIWSIRPSNTSFHLSRIPTKIFSSKWSQGAGENCSFEKHIHTHWAHSAMRVLLVPGRFLVTVRDQWEWSVSSGPCDGSCRSAPSASIIRPPDRKSNRSPATAQCFCPLSAQACRNPQTKRRGFSLVFVGPHCFGIWAVLLSGKFTQTCVFLPCQSSCFSYWSLQRKDEKQTFVLKYISFVIQEL